MPRNKPRSPNYEQVLQAVLEYQTVVRQAVDTLLLVSNKVETLIVMLDESGLISRDEFERRRLEHTKNMKSEINERYKKLLRKLH